MVNSMAVNEEQTAEIEQFLCKERVERFLYEEAALLDRREQKAWLSLLDEDIEYKAPLRITREHTNDNFSSSAYYFDEDYGSLKARVQRFESEYAWSERPPSRTRRFVSNVRASKRDDGTVEAKSYLLLYYGQGDSESYTFLAGRRKDVLRPDGETFTIAKRDVYLDHAVPKIDKISVFL
ncbi:small terminal subunit of phenylpropionate dioxygenase [Natronococcus jeotgali DSM 18795]|uniref:Small terminal subunit of phenylpropionate dioxygenase n=2 Tax=Natronococcus jeotgali TaxID=413812 RepID=L9XKR4_9EURY|nr:small terminal subunit of phenylpropionate dioxygenase [Natronococcus jeotgali DSM 18795]